MDLPLDARTIAARAAARPGRRDRRAPTALVVVLAPGRVGRLTRPHGLRLTVDAGRLWLTRGGCADDDFVGAGEARSFRGGGTVVVESDGDVPAVIRLERAPRSGPSRLDRVLGGLRRALRSAAGVARRAAARARALGSALARARRGRAERRALLALDDRTLRDVGVPDTLRARVRAAREADARGAVARTIDRCTW